MCYLVLGCERLWKDPMSRENPGNVIHCFEAQSLETFNQGRVQASGIVVMVNMATGESFFPAFIKCVQQNRITKPAKALGTHCHQAEFSQSIQEKAAFPFDLKEV